MKDTKLEAETSRGWFLRISLHSYKVWMHLQTFYQTCLPSHYFYSMINALSLHSATGFPDEHPYLYSWYRFLVGFNNRKYIVYVLCLVMTVFPVFSSFFANQWNMWYLNMCLLEPDQISCSVVAKRQHGKFPIDPAILAANRHCSIANKIKTKNADAGLRWCMRRQKPLFLWGGGGGRAKLTSIDHVTC